MTSFDEYPPTETGPLAYLCDCIFNANPNKTSKDKINSFFMTTKFMLINLNDLLNFI